MSFLSILNPFRNPPPAASPAASPAFIGPVASPTASDSRCDSEGFYQHLGECWNDSIQMIFLFSDGIKEIVQPALLDPNFDSKVESIINDERNKLYFLFKSDLKDLNTTNLGAVNNPFANNSTKEILASKVSERKNAIIEYFKVLKKRFMRHYTNESLRRESCDIKSDKEHSVFQRMSEISRAAGKDGIAAAALGHKNTEGVNRSHINIEELKKKSKEKKYEPGGDITDEYYLFNLYKLVFFFDKYEFKYTVFNDYRIRDINDKPENTLDLNISKELIQNSKAVFISSDINFYEINKKKKEIIVNNKDGHATAFYTCGTSEIYYEDNTGIYPFPWKNFLLTLVELYKNDKTTTFIFGNNTQTGNLVEVQNSSYYPIIRKGKKKFDSDLYITLSNNISRRSQEIVEMEKISSNNNKEILKNAKYVLSAIIDRKEELLRSSFTYYTFINDSPLLESKDRTFEYNGVSITVPDDEIRSIYTLIFMTINNNQAVNAQRFNHTARHGSINVKYFINLIKEPNPNFEKILQFLNAYIKSHILNKKALYTMISVTPKINREVNNKLLEIAEAHLDPTDVEKLRTKIPPIWMDEFGNIDDKYLDTLITARDSEGILQVFNEYLNSPEFKSIDRSVNVFNSSHRVYKNFIPVDPEFNQRLFELIKDNLGEDKEPVQEYIKNLAAIGSKGGYRKRKTRYQKRLIKRKTQKKRRSRR